MGSTGAALGPPADDQVIKPSVASGGLCTARYRASAREVADAHVDRLHEAGHTVMVQAYQAAVGTAGDTAVVFLGSGPASAPRSPSRLSWAATPARPSGSGSGR